MTRRRDDAGFSLVEVLVAISLFAFLTTAMMTVLISTSRAVRDGRQVSSLNEESRLALERMSREIRQARAIRAVTLPTVPNGPTSLTLWVDFNGNDVQDDVALDPEILTYSYVPAQRRVTLTANDENGIAIVRPILAENVTALDFGFKSSLYQYDANADGQTDWTELDASNTGGVGNRNGVLDPIELDKIDSITISLSLLEEQHKQTYQTQVGLRNKTQS